MVGVVSVDNVSSGGGSDDSSNCCCSVGVSNSNINRININSILQQYQ